MAEDKYCICCGENVPVNTITRDGNLELTCLYCGFVVDVAKRRPVVPRTLECVLTADDSASTRELLKGLLVARRLAKTVLAVENGQACVAEFTKQVAEGKAPSLVILDLEMPVMDGVAAARIVRAVEAKFQSVKTPILFFSARKCDEALKRQLELLEPASYVNKGAGGDPAQLIERVSQLISRLPSPS